MLLEQVRWVWSSGAGPVLAPNGISILKKCRHYAGAETTDGELRLERLGGVSIKYLTLLTGFVVGVDVAGGYVLGGKIPYLHFAGG